MKKGLQKVYRKLTKEQKRREVIFSSTLTAGKKATTEEKNICHEVFQNDPNALEKIRRLKDDSAFDEPDSPYNYNIIRIDKN